MVAAIIACVLAALGIFTFGIVFIPLAAIAAIIATISSLTAKNTNAIWVSVLAWVLCAIAVAASPVMLIAIVSMLGM